MGKRNKIEETQGSKHRVEVVSQNVTNHPMCLHGPTLLFSSDKGRYYGCASCRNKKDCTIHIEEDDWKKESVRKRNEKYYTLIPKLDKVATWNRLNEIKFHHPTDRAYCNTCQELYLCSQNKKHVKNHRVITHLTDEQISHPSSWLPTLENDTVEAQYIFAGKVVGTILNILKNNEIKNIICIGTPSVHEAAQESSEFDSILLDYDTRHSLFSPPNKFLWYNMFNDYLFNGGSDEKILKKFIKKSKDEGICVVMDPPFGGRVEALAQTLKELSTLYQKMCDKPEEELIPVLWAFPYFAEPYIKNMLPAVKMHDYQVEYRNHKKFNNKGRKFGSPIRFFTNLPLATINLSKDSNYKLCPVCKYWVHTTNRHCNKCKECTSKNGMTYKHCNTCKICVKPTFFHCKECERCCQEKGHVCGVIVESQSCYNCMEKGHKQAECPLLDASPKKRRKQA